MAEIQSNYHAGSELCSDGINNITSTINRAVDQANCQCDSEIEKLTKTFVEGQPFHASDMNTFVDKLNEIIDALNGTTEQWEIADIVIYDNVEDTKIKSTADCFSLDKFPENRYTPIGIVTEVLEDGSAKIISLPEMSYKTPDIGTVEYEPENIICGINNNLVDSKKVLPTYDNEQDLNIIGVSTDNLIYPSTDDESCVLLSKDNKRFYGENRFEPSVSGNYYNNLGPSAFNEDGTYNDDFFRENIQIDLVLYAWNMIDDSSRVVYTNTETISENTIGFIGKNGGSGFFISEGLENIAVQLLSNSDSGLTTGIFQLPFNSNYTRAREYDLINPVLKSATSERDGKINTLKMLQHQSDLYFDKEYQHEIPDRKIEYGYSGMYTATMKMWYRYNESDGKNYYLFTTNMSDSYHVESGSDDIDHIWIQNYNSYFVSDYGCLNTPTDGKWFYIGSVNDESIISGGKEGFLSKFTRVTGGTIYLYCWYRIKDGVYHFLYTSDDADNLNENTEIWINTIYTDGAEMSNFMTDYGNIWDGCYQDNKYHMYKAGTMSDESLIEGGVSGFLEKFTRCEKMIWMSDSPLLNIPIINHFPAESTSWRFHTPGTNQGDWYVPSVGELAVTMSNYHEIQNAFKSLIAAKVNVPVKTLSSGDYTTSTEQFDIRQKELDPSTTIYYVDDLNGGSGNYYGRYPFTVRVLQGKHSVMGLSNGSGSYCGCSSSFLRAFTKVRPLKNNS